MECLLVSLLATELTKALPTAAQRFLRELTSEQAVERDRKFTHTDAGCMPDRVRNRARCAGDADLANALDAKRVDMRIALLDQDRFER